eukprot:TRINITY_DN114_c0_g1_i2.p1 TRINITY_DN114_c0_g1~~TRINITY_DN114_c0_g1_i2.p1  ORF type:complete len:360 (+),score=68.11 TRINITY_DN114_c0_g1_i2:161-1240(+)
MLSFSSFERFILRFVDEELKLNLDLTYITERLIAMGFPAMGANALFRNSALDIDKFAEAFHPGHFRIFNMSEVDYRYPMWDSTKVHYHGWLDHHPCPLDHLLTVLIDIDNWLFEDSKNVALVHCVAGRSRTGTVIISYMLYKNLFDCPQKAIQYFNLKRGEEPSFILASQIRCVKNFFDLLVFSEANPDTRDNKLVNTQPLSAPPIAILKKMLITPVLKGEPLGDSCEPVLDICGPEGMFSNNGSPKYGTIFPGRRWLTSENLMAIDINKEVCGEVFIKFFHHTHIPPMSPIKIQLFRLSFHTYFQLGPGGDGNFLDFKLVDLDSSANTDDLDLIMGKRNVFPPNFMVRLLFQKVRMVV